MKQKCYDLTDKQILLLLTVRQSNKTLKNRLNDLLKKKKNKNKSTKSTKKIKIKSSTLRNNKIKKINVKKSRKKR